MATEHEVFTGITAAHAFLGNNSVFHTFRFNPDNVSWDYAENVVSRDTIGGRVVQLLSVQISGIEVQGRAGSRGELQRMADNIRSIMNYHLRTSRPVQFKVPSRQWDFQVYVQAMPQIGWDVSATSYPYQLSLAAVEDLNGVQSQHLGKAALGRLAEGIGYNPDVHGGDPAGFTKLVNSLLAAQSAGESSGSGPNTAGGNPNAPAPGQTTDSIKTVWSAVHQQFSNVGSAGTYVCKHISGSSSWSQHSWGNAWDITAPGGVSESPSAQAYLDEVSAWLMNNIGKGLKLPIAQVIWRGREQVNGGSVYDHFNHIHVSGSPMFSGTPPCA